MWMDSPTRITFRLSLVHEVLGRNDTPTSTEEDGRKKKEKRQKDFDHTSQDWSCQLPKTSLSPKWLQV
jgi:hypothetical protein